MKQIKTLVITAFCALLFLSSCTAFQEPNENYSLNSGTILLTNPIPDELTGTHTFYIVTDDSLIFIPQNILQYSDGTKYEPKNNDRIIFYYTTLENTQGTRTVETKRYQMINILQIGEIKTSEISKKDPDTLVNDIVDPLLIWYSGGIFNTKRCVTIKFSYLGYNLKVSPHDNFLVINEKETSHIEDGYFKLTFRHDPKKDPSVYTFTGFVSFELPQECTAEGIKGLAISFNTPSQGSKEIKVDY